MEREILFRGKAKDHTEWVFGMVVKFRGINGKIRGINGKIGTAIIREMDGENILPCTCSVDERTVGQYTCLKDYHGNKIYEGDIVSNMFAFPTLYVVRFDENRGGWFPFACGDGCGCCEYEVINNKCCEVCGNIHDNQEMLEDEEE